MKTISNLTECDYIAFEWAFGVFGHEIVVAPVSSIRETQVLVHFLYGYKSEAEWILKKDIIAIGDNDNGKSKIKNYRGLFNILISDHPLL